MADAEERALSRVRQMTGQDDPHLDSFDQEALACRGRYIERDLAGELGRLERLRAAHLAELAKLDGLGGSAPGGTASMARCRSSCMRLMSLPRRSITLPRSPAAVLRGIAVSRARACPATGSWEAQAKPCTSRPLLRASLWRDAGSGSTAGRG